MISYSRAVFGCKQQCLLELTAAKLESEVLRVPQTILSDVTEVPLFSLNLLYSSSPLWAPFPSLHPLGRRRQWQPTPVLLPGKSHGQRSRVGFSPWGLKESDTTERLHFHFLLSCIGEGNGNPLQCSCLESPRDSRAWWASVYGVAESRTRLR